MPTVDYLDNKQGLAGLQSMRSPHLWICDREPCHASSKRYQVLLELQPELRKLVAVNRETAPPHALQSRDPCHTA